VIVVGGKPQIGWFGEDIVDAVEDVAEGAYDVATSVIDNIHDAGTAIGSVLKFISPIVAFWPGIGTAISVAMYAAGAAAAADRLDDAIIGTASAAMPPGLPRIGFDSGVAITREIVAGRDAFDAVIDTCRSAAQKADPSGRALYAFDTGLAIARGGKVSAEALKLARTNVAQGGQSAVVAFDVAVNVGQGKAAPEVLLGVARNYIENAGGPMALAAFDSGVALAYGKSLQDVGFIALQGMVAGNDSGARAVLFIEKMVRAAEAGVPVWTVLVDDLGGEIMRAVGAAGGSTAILKEFAPVLEAINLDPNLLNLGSQDWADAWGVAEPLIRGAKEIARDTIPNLRNYLSGNYVKSIGRVKSTPEQIEAERVRWSAVTAQNPGVPEICLRASDAKARNSPAAPNLEAQCKAAGGRPLVKMSTTTAKAASAISAYSLASPSRPVEPPKPPPPRFVPPAVVASIVKTGAPPKSATVVRNGVGSDLALGGVVALAGVALFWWATAEVIGSAAWRSRRRKFSSGSKTS